MAGAPAARWAIYGANGFTGNLVAREAARLGLTPVLAGRNRRKVEALGRALGLETRAFPLGDPSQIAHGLRAMELVLHCAGPFGATARPMLDACSATGTHYLDVSGEVAVLESIYTQNDRWRAAGIIVIPGVGANVLPTDCLAAMLKQRLPDATHLRIAGRWLQRVSAGTAKSMVEGIPQEGRVRVDGELKQVPHAFKTATIPFADGPGEAMTGPLGDVAAAYYSTGIPNIEAYVALPARQMRRPPAFILSLFRRRLVQGIVKGIIQHTMRGPSDRERATGRSQYWAEVTNAAGAHRRRRLGPAS